MIGLKRGLDRRVDLRIEGLGDEELLRHLALAFRLALKAYEHSNLDVLLFDSAVLVDRERARRALSVEQEIPLSAMRVFLMDDPALESSGLERRRCLS